MGGLLAQEAAQFETGLQCSESLDHPLIHTTHPRVLLALTKASSSESVMVGACLVEGTEVTASVDCTVPEGRIIGMLILCEVLDEDSVSKDVALISWTLPLYRVQYLVPSGQSGHSTGHMPPSVLRRGSAICGETPMQAIIIKPHGL